MLTPFTKIYTFIILEILWEINFQIETACNGVYSKFYVSLLVEPTILIF